MDLKLSTKKSKLIILSLLFFVFIWAGGYLLWRVNQPETVAPEESEASLSTGSSCDCGNDKRYCSTCSDWQSCLDEYGCCDCHGWKSSGSCYNCSQYAVCGSLDGKNFAYTVTSWPSTDFCGDGVYGGTPSPSSPIFPKAGKTTSWQCVGAARTVSCSASRKAVPNYTVTYKAGTNGSITGTQVQTVSHGGSTISVTAVPNPGYYFGGWSDGKSTNPREDTNVTEDITVIATFSLSCGNGTCEAEENAQSCPADCDANCGDGYCTHDEDVSNCPEDCSAVCGDGQCTHNENSVNCLEDCGPVSSGGVPSTGIFDDTKTAMASGFLLIILGFTWRFFGRGIYLSVEFLGKVPRKISIQMKDLKADIRAKRRVKEMKVADKRKKNFERKVVKD